MRARWANEFTKRSGIAEAEKYATAESKFTFVLEDATEDDIAEMRSCLTPREREIVEITHKQK